MVDDDNIRIVTVAQLPGRAVAVYIPAEQAIVVAASNPGQQVTALARLVGQLLDLSAERNRPLLRAD